MWELAAHSGKLTQMLVPEISIVLKNIFNIWGFLCKWSVGGDRDNLSCKINNLDFLEQTVRRNIIIRDIVEDSEGNK